MNAAIRAVVRTGIYEGFEMVGSLRGYHGLISGEIVPLHSRSVSNIIQRGGTILKSARCKTFYEKEGRQKAYNKMQTIGIDALVVIGGDGQVSMGDTIMKGNARKVRRLYNDRVIAGFAGGTADAFTLFELFEGKLETYNGQLTRAAVELAKDWRTNKMLRNLEALLAVADKETSLIISGNGDVIEPEFDTMAIGSGGASTECSTTSIMTSEFGGIMP